MRMKLWYHPYRVSPSKSQHSLTTTIASPPDSQNSVAATFGETNLSTIANESSTDLDTETSRENSRSTIKGLLDPLDSMPATNGETVLRTLISVRSRNRNEHGKTCPKHKFGSRSRKQGSRANERPQQHPSQIQSWIDLNIIYRTRGNRYTYICNREGKIAS